MSSRGPRNWNHHRQRSNKDHLESVRSQVEVLSHLASASPLPLEGVIIILERILDAAIVRPNPPLLAVVLRLTDLTTYVIFRPQRGAGRTV